ncbi:MAG: hypothetical protein ACJZ5D_06120 [Candidatus Thalassarchaeaceae archaeon]
MTVGWSETFETGTELDSVLYQNETNLVFDETVSSLVINFRAQFPYSSTVEDLVGNDTNQVRYVEARLWEPGTQQSGGSPLLGGPRHSGLPRGEVGLAARLHRGHMGPRGGGEGLGSRHSDRATVIPRLVRPVRDHDQAMRPLP